MIGCFVAVEELYGHTGRARMQQTSNENIHDAAQVKVVYALQKPLLNVLVDIGIAFVCQIEYYQYGPFEGLLAHVQIVQIEFIQEIIVVVDLFRPVP
jgi:hypothetical protein